ncbi:MAG: PilZ domain-containing protein [Candidatus Electronema sp. V4]|uniref:PilZ domain-containing protein n=1 Tax=Candidatus Electronema sp. V4 TaxID=3454756 RepID=UPI0040557A8C
MMIVEYQPEKRRHHRIIFKEPKKIAALVSLLDQEQEREAVASSILNMSAGGIQISVERSALDNVWRGREILLHCVSGLPELLELADVPMQVVWVMDNEYLDHILIGAAFAALSEEQERILHAFVDNCLIKKQQC